MISDEVQIGYGRLGAFWGSTLQGLVPDIITVAKAAGAPTRSGPCSPAVRSSTRSPGTFFSSTGGTR